MLRIIMLVVLLVCSGDTQSRAQVNCHYVPNGTNITIYCTNGYWQTTTPDGFVYQGNGIDDPSATARGSNIVIDPRTGGPFIGAGPTVEAPTQNLPMLAPFQGQQFGYPLPE